MNIEILYEDKDVVVINKPAGLVVHPDGRTEEPTLVDWILEKYPDVKEVGEPWKSPKGEMIYRPGIVHRLDRETSGVLIVAKNQDAFMVLKAQFQERDIKKVYHAFVYGEIKEDEGVVNRPIGKSNKDFRMWSAQRGARGELREAITEYKVLKRTETGNIRKGFSYVELQPKTGRTHQIRVHLKAINHPVICDTLYAPKMEPALGFTRLALHAKSIEFARPYNGMLMTIEAPLPEDFERALHSLT
jgi:23S rRNA pseudouridine1911/1915/1917 synthase